MPKKVQSERKESSKSKSKVDKLEAMYSANPQLRTAVAQIEKNFGQGAIMPLSMDSAPSLSGISTGSLSLDLALGGCGIPHGRVIEIFGPESSGKTTLTLHVVANCQKAGGIAAFIDAEHAFDPSWAKKLGVDLESLLVSQPGSGEEAMRIVELLLHSNAVDLVIIDSVAALVPEKELSGEIGDQHVGLVARLMSQSLRKLTALISKCKTAVVFINQIRDKIGMVGYGSPETTPGGRALKFFASQRLDVRRVGQVKDGEDIIGQRVKVKVAKNKVAPPFRSAEFDMLVKGRKCGISSEGDILDLALAHKLVTKSGAWFKSGDQQIAQGREKVRQYMMENPDFTEQLRKELMTKVNEEGSTSVLEIDTEGKAAADDF